MNYHLDQLEPPNSTPLLRLGVALRECGYSFTTVTPLTHQRANRHLENEEGYSLGDIFGWSRPFHRATLGEQLFGLMQEADVLEAQGERWASLVRWSSLGNELFVHSRFPTNSPDAVFFGPDTYRFTHALQEHLARADHPLQRIVDIGCGAGPGAVLAALARPKAQVLALDINDRALAFTVVNARLAGTANLLCRHSDLLREVDGLFDLIISNPPYLLDAEQRTYRHGGGEYGTGLSLAIVDAAIERLAPGGTLLLYTGVAMFKGADHFLSAVRLSLNDDKWDWSYREIDPDVFGEELENPNYANASRIACVVLRLTRRK